jgi:hypothetical protein
MTSLASLAPAGDRLGHVTVNQDFWMATESIMLLIVRNQITVQQ